MGTLKNSEKDVVIKRRNKTKENNPDSINKVMSSSKVDLKKRHKQLIVMDESTECDIVNQLCHDDTSHDDDRLEVLEKMDKVDGMIEESHSSEVELFHDDTSRDGDCLGVLEKNNKVDGLIEESDSSEDEVYPRNTIGDVPLKWYKDEEHIGYDIQGRKIKKKVRQDKLDTFLASADDPKSWMKIYDEYNDEEIQITKQEAKLISKLLKGKAPHADFDPYAPYVDWFSWDDSIHPLSNAPEPKSRFVPSKWEAKKIAKYVRLIRKGLIKFEKHEKKPRFYLLWGEDSSSVDDVRRRLSYIPPPKTKLPGHEVSYNPPLEYIPTQEEINSYQLLYEEDRPRLIPTRFTSLRSVPAYGNAVKDSFDRCLDLYLCPRVRKKRINIDPESLKPKLPSRKDLKPFPQHCYLEYKGHTGPVTSISTEISGHWIASGSTDGTVRIWEVETGRCLRVWDFSEAVLRVAWNPDPDLHILAIAIGHDVFIINTELGDEEQQKRIQELLSMEKTSSSDGKRYAVWSRTEAHAGIHIKHQKTLNSVEWHRKGDYFSTVAPGAESRTVLIHQLTKKESHKIKFPGLPISSAFHPTRSVFFVSTKNIIWVFDLSKMTRIKKLETGMREVSSFAVHPAGDNVIVGSKEGKLCWFDMDLSSQPYRILKCHPKDITSIVFHRTYPLFASSSEDCTAYVFHGMVYSDYNQNPLIVPLNILRGHTDITRTGWVRTGVTDCKFHPRQPWLFTAGADSVLRLYCH